MYHDGLWFLETCTSGLSCLLTVRAYKPLRTKLAKKGFHCLLTFWGCGFSSKITWMFHIAPNSPGVGFFLWNITSGILFMIYQYLKTAKESVFFEETWLTIKTILPHQCTVLFTQTQLKQIFILGMDTFGRIPVLLLPNCKTRCFTFYMRIIE